jgi:hypothetical protein
MNITSRLLNYTDRYFALKINAAIAADAFYRLHNDKYTKNSPRKNCVNRA